MIEMRNSERQEFRELQQVYLQRAIDSVAVVIGHAADAAHYATVREECRMIAHRLRGSGGGYGFPAVSERATRLEIACREQAPVAVVLAQARELNAAIAAAATSLGIELIAPPPAP